jgi:beta-glucosidase
MAWASPAETGRLVRPIKQIFAFAKAKPLLPGEETIKTLELDIKSLSVWDDERGSWVVDAGRTFNILLGTNASNAQPAWVLQVPGEVTRPR